MNEPLFDNLTVVSVCLAMAAVLTLRPADPPPTNVDRIKQRHVIGLALLALSVGTLMFRWVESVAAFSGEHRLGMVRQALLTAACGFGVATAILSVTAETIAARVKSFLAVAGSGVIALLLAAAWEWALLWIALLAFGCWAVMRVTQRAADVGSDNSGEINSAQEIVGQESAGQEAVGPESAVKVAAGFAEFNAAIGAATEHETPRESGLIMLAAAALLVILLGTWQHVVEHEGQRLTRSTRYSAWPRATALANAWERSGWVVKRDEHSPQQFDRASVELMARTASREQNIAWGLGVMLLVVAGVAWRQSNDRVDASENSQEVSHGN